MISVPLYFFLFVFLAFVVIAVIFYFLILFHIIHSASFTFASFLMSFLVLAAGTLVIYEAWLFIAGVDWQATAFSLDFSSFQSQSTY